MNPIIEKIAREIYEHEVDLPSWHGLDPAVVEHYRRIARGLVQSIGLADHVDLIGQLRDG